MPPMLDDDNYSEDSSKSLQWFKTEFKKSINHEFTLHFWRQSYMHEGGSFNAKARASLYKSVVKSLSNTCVPGYSNINFIKISPIGTSQSETDTSCTAISMSSIEKHLRQGTERVTDNEIAVSIDTDGPKLMQDINQDDGQDDGGTTVNDVFHYFDRTGAMSPLSNCGVESGNLLNMHDTLKMIQCFADGDGKRAACESIYLCT